MSKLAIAQTTIRVFFLTALLAGPIGRALAQDGEAASSPAGLTMLVLFLGIAGIIGVFVVRWGQSTGDEDEQA